MTELALFYAGEYIIGGLVASLSFPTISNFRQYI